MKPLRNLLAGTLLATGALMTAAAGISTAAADEAATEWHHGHGDGQWHMLRKLGLSPSQRQSIKDIMAAQRAETRAQVFKVLTPAQQEQLKALEAERQAR